MTLEMIQAGADGSEEQLWGTAQVAKRGSVSSTQPCEAEEGKDRPLCSAPARPTWVLPLLWVPVTRAALTNWREGRGNHQGGGRPEAAGLGLV